MIKETLGYLSSGDITLNELAKKSGVGIDELKQRLQMLEHMGYIVQEDVEMGVGTCGSCSYCPSSKTCSGIALKSGIKIVTYQLTEKGKRAC